LLIEWTEQPWNVSIAEAVGEPTLVERKDAAEALVREEVSADPVVAAVLENFPGSAVEAVRPLIAQGIGEVEMHPESIDDDDLYNDDDDDGGVVARVKDG
jgi:DNA polymerase-3 subunit gamma/tau